MATSDSVGFLVAIPITLKRNIINSNEHPVARVIKTFREHQIVTQDTNVTVEDGKVIHTFSFQGLAGGAAEELKEKLDTVLHTHVAGESGYNWTKKIQTGNSNCLVKQRLQIAWDVWFTHSITIYRIYRLAVFYPWLLECYTTGDWLKVDQLGFHIEDEDAEEARTTRPHMFLNNLNKHK
ncbi:Myc-type, basic helix-loop-helix (bHLH) domain-containing protein [Artemisia annua]|uniref:Myc-type, basic helix-loop-helix (BHLH) domain-containing protein n=1 Tax=Artemisia annua TaxID=35608 RepID=A0A2U1QIJ2_ARTAN|nr:Myc-type, basic helix-loop-helix (bHLH) domain-containing protein [Artemisia annua]